MQLCSKCHKRLAVVFVGKMINDKIENEGYCLRCAKGLGIAQVDALMNQYGISEDDLDRLEPDIDENDLPAVVDENDDEGKAPAIDFMKILGSVGGMPPLRPFPNKDKKSNEQPKKEKGKGKGKD